MNLDAPRTGLSRQIERSAINAIEAWCDQVESASLGDAEAFDTASEKFRSSVARVNELRELEIELVEIDELYTDFGVGEGGDA